MSALLLAVLVGVGAFAASGVGRLLLARACAGTPLRMVLAEYLGGLLAYTTLFGLLANLRLPLNLVAVLLLGCLAVGLWARRGHEVRLSLGCAAAVTVSLGLLVGLMPTNPNALDPTTYAFMATSIFQDRWLADNLTSLPDSEWLRGTANEGVVTRAPALALVWPATALGWGISARTVTGMAAWFFLPTFAAITDVLDGYAPLLPRLVLAAGAIGVYNEVAVVVDAQVNQAFALAVVVGLVWACRWMRSRRAQAVLLVLGGAAVSAGYPEFLAALPVYLACSALFSGSSVRSVVADGLFLVAGWGLVQLSTGLRNVRFLVEEAGASPEWWPLASDPHNLGEVWLDILIQRPPPLLLAVVLIPAGWYAWRTERCGGCAAPCPRLVWLVLGSLLAFSAVWSWLALRGPNPNYATFKLGGWLTPGLFIVAVALIRRTRGLAERMLMTLLFLLATSRLLGIAVDGPPKLILYATAPTPAAAWRVVPPSGAAADCLVEVASKDRREEMAAIAESSAPARACRLQ